MIKKLVAALVLLAPCAAFGQVATKQAQIQPMPPVATACCTLTLGGTAQNFQNATSNSGTATQSPVACVIVNPASATDQGIGAAEEIWVNVNGAATTSAGGNSVPIAPGGNIMVWPATNAISWNAATTGHKIAGYCWQ